MAGGGARGKAKAMPAGRRRAFIALMLAACASCSGSSSHEWHGYYYGDVLSHAPAQVHGPYESAPRCIAAMQPLLRHAPTTANFICARDCHAASDGSLETCEEMAR